MATLVLKLLLSDLAHAIIQYRLIENTFISLYHQAFTLTITEDLLTFRGNKASVSTTLKTV